MFGGAANLWDCIPSKTMIATGGAMSFSRRLGGMGLAQATPEIDIEGLTSRVRGIQHELNDDIQQLLRSQGVTMINGTARFTSGSTAEATGPDGVRTIEFDTALISTGSRPRIPEWCDPDGDRILTTRDCYPPKVFPDSITVIGSGVTGVEFVHMFSSFGAEVTLVVSRQHVLPGKDPEVAGVLEDDFVERGVKLLKGARAVAIDRDDNGDVIVRCDDGRTVRSTHAVLAIGSVPNTDGIGLDAAGVVVDRWGHIPIDDHCRTNQGHIYAAGDAAEFEGTVYGIIPAAIEQARVAAANMVREEAARYHGTLPSTTLKIGEAEVTSLGECTVDSADTIALRFIDLPAHRYRKLVLRDKLPVGAILLNYHDQLQPVTQLIQRHITIPGDTDRFLTEEIDWSNLLPSSSSRPS